LPPARAEGPRALGSSADNVEIARRACEAAWRRPKPDVETLNAVADPGHMMFPIQSLVEDAISAGPDRVLVTGRIKFTGSGGGVPVDQRFWVAMTLRDGKVIRSEVHTERDRALAGLGRA
jgi:hypothetical protein